MMLAHPERELVVALVRLVRELFRHRVGLFQRVTRVTLLRLFGAVCVAEEASNRRALDESRFRRRELLLQVALLARGKVKQVQSFERRNVRLDGRLYLAIAVH